MPSITKLSEKRQPPHVLVIGAGTTGLLVAQGLKKNGIPFSVYERTDSNTYVHRQRDWTMALHWGSHFIKQCLPDHLAEELPSVQPDTWIELTNEQEHIFPMIDGRTGEAMLKRKELTTRRASREKLRKLLARGIDVNYGKKLINIQHDRPDGKVVAEFDDGTSAIGDCLIGCDSVHSRVRRNLLGDKAELQTLPVLSYNFTCYYPEEQARYLRNTGHPLMKSAVHGGSHSFYMIPTMDIKDPNDPKTWKFQHFINFWREGEEHLPTSEERLANFKKLAGSYAEPFGSAARMVPDDTYIPADRIRHWAKICPWPNHQGTCTIAGDAAHAMAPFRGNGLNNGLEDASRYVGAIMKVVNGEASLQQAVDEYDAEVLQRGAREIKTSAIQGYSSMHPDEFLKSSPVASYGFSKINYNTHPFEDLPDFQTQVSVPDTAAINAELKVH